MATKDFDLKIKLESDLSDVKQTKESLKQQGLFKSDPKKLQQLELAIQQLESLLKTFDPKSNAQLNQVRSSFSKIIDVLVKGSLELGNASEKIQQLYKSLNTVSEKLGK